VPKQSLAVKKSKGRPEPTSPFTSGEDEKMHKIVDEVDRFFQSVHADIEDWKFSMEDYGDGTRVFVRFQIHINTPGSPVPRSGSKEKPLSTGTAGDRSVSRAVSGGKADVAASAPTEDTHEPDRPGTTSRADSDLASFVQLWRNKRNSNQGSSYHKEGAPYLDDGSEWKGRKRSGVEGRPERASESAKAGSQGGEPAA
jgi:hypothetical protein